VKKKKHENKTKNSKQIQARRRERKRKREKEKEVKGREKKRESPQHTPQKVFAIVSTSRLSRQMGKLYFGFEQPTMLYSALCHRPKSKYSEFQKGHR
jgi:hypothetical protein